MRQKDSVRSVGGLPGLSLCAPWNYCCVSWKVACHTGPDGVAARHYSSDMGTHRVAEFGTVRSLSKAWAVASGQVAGQDFIIPATAQAAN